MTTLYAFIYPQDLRRALTEGLAAPDETLGGVILQDTPDWCYDVPAEGYLVAVEPPPQLWLPDWEEEEGFYSIPAAQLQGATLHLVRMLR